MNYLHLATHKNKLLFVMLMHVYTLGHAFIIKSIYMQAPMAWGLQHPKSIQLSVKILHYGGHQRKDDVLNWICPCNHKHKIIWKVDCLPTNIERQNSGGILPRHKSHLWYYHHTSSLPWSRLWYLWNISRRIWSSLCSKEH